MTNNFKNLILITIDCLRTDHVGCYGYPRNTTPNIDILSNKSLFFNQSISSGGGTPIAFPSILASVFPPLNPNQYKKIMKDNVSIAEVFRKHGYRTAAFHSNPYLSRFYYYNKGFDVFYDSLKNDFKKTIIDRFLDIFKNTSIYNIETINNFFSNISMIYSGKPIINAEDITKKANSWIKSSPGKFFLWIHYMDVHHPYFPPKSYRNIFFKGNVTENMMYFIHLKSKIKLNNLMDYNKNMLISLYDACIHYVDYFIGFLINNLKDKLKNTIIVITADHGEEFWDHGFQGHDISVYDEVIKVPLIIYIPGIDKKIKIVKQFNLINLTPTLLDLFRINSQDIFYGKSLLIKNILENEINQEVLSISITPITHTVRIAYRTESIKYIRTHNYNYVINKNNVLKRELYDLKNDPNELINNLNITNINQIDNKIDNIIRNIEKNKGGYKID